jgi:hypothetical protein
MPYEQREGQGSLFRNDKKGNPKAPDWKGTCLLNGVTMEISGWIKDGKRGEFYSLQIKPKEERNTAPQGGDDDRIPF